MRNYIKIVDTATIYEASGLQLIEIANKQDDKFVIVNEKLWHEIENFWQENDS